MDKAHEVANKFLQRLEKGEIKKEYLPNQGNKLTKELVNKDLKEYREFLSSDFFAETCKM